MYDPLQILRSIDDHLALFRGLSAAALIFNYIYFVAAIVAGRRHRVFPFPLAACTIWFAHDVSYLFQYSDWFHVYDHWYLKQFWYGLIPTSIIEAIYIYQVWLYGRDELLPGASRRLYSLYIVVAIMAGGIAWCSVKYFLNDPIYAYTFGATGYLAVLFNVPRALARRDSGGQSALMWVGYVGMQSCWFVITMIVFGSAFLSVPYLATGVACIIGGIFMIVVCLTFRRPSTVDARSVPMPMRELAVQGDQ